MKCDKLLSELRLLSTDYELVINSLTNDYCLPHQNLLRFCLKTRGPFWLANNFFKTSRYRQIAEVGRKL